MTSICFKQGKEEKAGRQEGGKAGRQAGRKEGRKERKEDLTALTFPASDGSILSARLLSAIRGRST